MESAHIGQLYDLEALALGFGTGAVGAVVYHLLEETGVIADAAMTDVILVMAVTYALSVVVAQRRYA